MSVMVESYTRHPWQDHYSTLDWKQGEHIFIAGPTSAGKTTLMSKLVPRRSHVVVFVTKLHDETFAREFSGWNRLEEWPKGGPPPWMNRILLWPKPVKNNMAGTLAKQRAVFADAMDRIGTQGNRCVVVDEMLMFCDAKILNLGNTVGMLHYFGRSHGITMVTLTQRPAWIPRVVMSSVTHAYVAKTTDNEDLKRLSEMGGVDKREVGDSLKRLPDRHDYVYLNPQGDTRSVIVNTRI
jgi:energy-coupling factor transporter ATP-binding protein EcfA2